MANIEEIFITEDDLQELNKAIDKVIEDKKLIGQCSWDFIEDLALFYCNNCHINEISKPKIIVLKMRKMLELALDFYKSIDEEFYERVANIILGKYKNIKFTMFKRSEIENFDEMDDTPGFEQFEKYKCNPCNFDLNKKVKLYMPILCGFKYDEELSKKLKKDEGTIEDLYALVHELAHTLALFIEENEKDKEHDILNPYADIFRESIAIGFERAFTEYLLKKGIIKSKSDIEKHHMDRRENTLSECLVTYSKLALATIKEEKGEITTKDFNDVFNKTTFDNVTKNNLFQKIINDYKSNKYLYDDARYAFSGAISPIIEELINEGKIDKIKEFIEASKKEAFIDALRNLGVTVNENEIFFSNQAMVKELSEFDRDINEEER